MTLAEQKDEQTNPDQNRLLVFLVSAVYNEASARCIVGNAVLFVAKAFYCEMILKFL